MATTLTYVLGSLVMLFSCFSPLRRRVFHFLTSLLFYLSCFKVSVLCWRPPRLCGTVIACLTYSRKRGYLNHLGKKMKNIGHTLGTLSLSGSLLAILARNDYFRQPVGTIRGTFAPYVRAVVCSIAGCSTSFLLTFQMSLLHPYM